MEYLSSKPTFSIMGPGSSRGYDELFVDPYPVINKDDQGMFYYDGMNIPFYMSKAKNQKGLVVGCSGLTSHYLLSEEEIKDLNDNGLSVIWMALPLTRSSKDFMPRFTKLAEAFFTHPHSPVFREFPDPNITRWTMEHSTGVQIMFKLLHNPAIREKMKHIYSGALHVAGYFDSAFASLEYPEWMQKRFVEYCEENKEKLAGEGLIGALYVKVMATKEHFTKKFRSEEEEEVSKKREPLPSTGNIFVDFYNEFTRSSNPNSPTYPQVLEVMGTGRKLQHEFNAKAVNIYPHVFVSDPKDRFACTKTTVRIAKSMDALMIPSGGGGHEPLKNNPGIRHDLINMVHDCVRLKERARSAFLSVPVHDIYAIKEPLPIDLGDRASLAFKSGASLLYAGAGLAQSLLARGIGNPEVG